MLEIFKIGDEEHSLWVSKKNRSGIRVHLLGAVIDAALEDDFGVRRRVRINGEVQELLLAVEGDRLHVHLGGIAYEIDYISPISHFAEDAAGSKSDRLLAPMPGAVIACAVRTGDMVEPGDLLMVIESMKLETPLKAWRAGRIETVHAGVGQAFERDRLLLSMTPVDAV